MKTKTTIAIMILLVLTLSFSAIVYSQIQTGNIGVEGSSVKIGNVLVWMKTNRCLVAITIDMIIFFAVL